MGDDESSNREDAAALVARVLEGDAAAMSEMTARVAPVFRAHVRLRLRRWRGGRMGAADEDDLVNDLFAALFDAPGRKAMEKWDFARTNVETFARIWAKSRLTERERKEVRRLRILEALGLDDDDGEALAAERPDWIVELVSSARAILDCVDARHTTPLARRMVDLILRERLETDEVIERTEMNRQSVFRWRSRIMATALECLGRLLDLRS